MSFQPPVCEDGVNIVKRRKRQVVELTDRDAAYDVLEKEETIKVFSNLAPLLFKTKISYCCLFKTKISYRCLFKTKISYRCLFKTKS